MRKRLQFIIFIFLPGFITQAQERINTDRPDQTESVVLTPRHFFQAEFGFGAENRGPSDYDIIHPTGLFKYGLTKRFELRLEANYVSSYVLAIPAGTKKTTGLEPVKIGFRTALWEEKKWIPKTSILVHFGLPGLASKNFKAQHVAPSFLLAMQNTLSEKIGIGYNVGAEWDGFSSTPVWIYSLSTGFDLGKKWEGFVEVFGFAQKNELVQNYFDSGLGFYINDNIKLDASVGFGITEAASNNFFGLGVSFRFH